MTTSASSSAVYSESNVSISRVLIFCASPGATRYTAGASPQTLYLSATTSINSVTYNGTHLLPVATSASASFTVGLGPNESVVVSYSGAMTANVMTH